LFPFFNLSFKNHKIKKKEKDKKEILEKLVFERFENSNKKSYFAI